MIEATKGPVLPKQTLRDWVLQARRSARSVEAVDRYTEILKALDTLARGQEGQDNPPPPPRPGAASDSKMVLKIHEIRKVGMNERVNQSQLSATKVRLPRQCAISTPSRAPHQTVRQGAHFSRKLCGWPHTGASSILPIS